MSIDEVILGSVSHYLGGMIGSALAIHSEMKETGRKLVIEIYNSRESCLKHGRAMLQDPVPEQYSHQEDYHLTPEDRLFLKTFVQKSERSNWDNENEVRTLMEELNRYAPQGSL